MNPFDVAMGLLTAFVLLVVFAVPLLFVAAWACDKWQSRKNPPSRHEDEHAEGLPSVWNRPKR